MSSSTALVIDASCDLPKSFLDSHELIILPTRVKHGDKDFVDIRDMKSTLGFYRNVLQKNKDVRLEPANADVIAAIVKAKIINKFDAVRVISPHSDWSEIHKNVKDAAFINNDNFKSWREAAGLDPKFRLRVLDSGSFFSGQGLLVYEAVRLLKEKALSVDKMKKPLELFKSHIDTYVVMDNVSYLRAYEKFEAGSMGWFDFGVGKVLGQKPAIRCYQNEVSMAFRERGYDATLAKVLERAKEHIDDGLERPVVNISYAGNLAEIRSNVEFTKFVKHAKSQHVKILLSMASTSAGAIAGPKAFSISYAYEEYVS